MKQKEKFNSTENSKPTLLFVEEVKTILIEKLMKRNDLNLVILRFSNCMDFEKEHLDTTSVFPCFIYDKQKDVNEVLEDFKTFCVRQDIEIDYFYNDSEYNQELIQEFASRLSLKGSITKEQAGIVRDKAVMKDRIREMGYGCMDHEIIKQDTDVDDFAKKRNGYPVIVKWRRGMSAKEVYKISSLEQLKKLNLSHEKSRYIVEQYCPFKIWCIDALVQDGLVLKTFLTWLPYTNLSFAESKTKFAQITVSKNKDYISFDGDDLAQDIISKLDLKDGYLHLEAFIDDDGMPIICEFAWRTSGEHMLSNHGLAHGIDVYSLLIDILVGKKVAKINDKNSRCVGDMFLPISDGKIKYITPLSTLLGKEGVIDGEIYHKVGDDVESQRKYTSCSGWLQVSGDTKDEVLDRMKKIYDEFEINFC